MKLIAKFNHNHGTGGKFVHGASGELSLDQQSMNRMVDTARLHSDTASHYAKGSKDPKVLRSVQLAQVHAQKSAEARTKGDHQQVAFHRDQAGNHLAKVLRAVRDAAGPSKDTRSYRAINLP